jgi:nucleotide-binding universal stress UspA family protein
MQFKKALVALDGSARAENALPWIRRIAPDANLALFQAVEQSFLTDSEPQIHLAEQYLQGLARRIERPTHSIVRQASPAAGILDAADEQSADLIAVTPHGTVGERSIGRVTEKLMHSCPRPLLIVPTQAAPPAGRLHFVVPLDGSAVSESGVTAAEPLARSLGAAVSIVNVMGEPTVGEGRPFHNLAELFERHRSDMDEYLEKIAAELRGRGVEAAASIVPGRFPDDLLRYCRDREASLIVMSAHGKGVIGRYLLGSAARELIEVAPIPVLLLRR